MATEEEKVLEFLMESLGPDNEDDDADMELRWADKELFGSEEEQSSAVSTTDEKKQSRCVLEYKERKQNADTNDNNESATTKEEIRRMCHEYLMFLDKNHPLSAEEDSKNEPKARNKESKKESKETTPNNLSEEENEDTAGCQEAKPRQPRQGVHPPELFAGYMKNSSSTATASAAQATEDGACCLKQ